jgi:molybdenum cofactor synthesis domain-containing protein
MRPLKGLISFDEALRIAIDAVRPIHRTEILPLPEVLHRVAAQDVRSTIDVPIADRSAMDGYAVVAGDTKRASKERPATLVRIETLHADNIAGRRVTSGHCVEVATGSTLPPGADAVVRVEDTDRRGESVRIFAAVDRGQNVVRRGVDVRRGSVVVRAGEEMTPAKVGALAAIGRPRVSVFAKPRISILTSGDELVPPGTRIRPGQVYDINSYTMADITRENGGEAIVLGRVSDRAAAVRSALRRGLRNDMVVVTGGSSAGERDLVVDVLRSIGDVRFHGIAIKPGKPTALGSVDGKPVLVMPGNPTSCLTNGYVLLAPMLRKMARLPPQAARTIEVPLARAIQRTPGRLEFHTVRIEGGRAVSAFKESGAITSMAHADGYVEIPADVDRLEAGELIRVVLF